MAKLQSAGIDIQGFPLCSSDDSVDRQKIMRTCYRKMHVSSGAAVYIGDGPWDLRAADALGWGFIAIGERLKGSHEPWIPDFRGGAWREALLIAEQQAKD